MEAWRSQNPNRNFRYPCTVEVEVRLAGEAKRNMFFVSQQSIAETGGREHLKKIRI